MGFIYFFSLKVGSCQLAHLIMPLHHVGHHLPTVTILSLYLVGPSMEHLGPVRMAPLGFTERASDVHRIGNWNWEKEREATNDKEGFDGKDMEGPLELRRRVHVQRYGLSCLRSTTMRHVSKREWRKVEN